MVTDVKYPSENSECFFSLNFTLSSSVLFVIFLHPVVATFPFEPVTVQGQILSLLVFLNRFGICGYFGFLCFCFQPLQFGGKFCGIPSC